MKKVTEVAALGLGILLTLPAFGQHLTLTAHTVPAVASGQSPRVGGLDPNETMSLAISLPLRNEAALDDLLQQIYDPQNSNYRHYLSVAEFTDRFGPAQSDHDAVARYVEGHGLRVSRTRANRLVMDVDGSVAAVENAFHLKMGTYSKASENRTFYAPDREPSLDLAVPVLHISGLDNYVLPVSKRVTSASGVTGKATGSGPGGQFVGSDVRAAYYGSGPLTGTGQSVGLFEFAGYEVSDVQRYFQTLNQPLNVPVVGVSLNGVSLDCAPPRCDDAEQALDIEMAIAMAPGLSQVVVYVGKSDVSIFAQMAADNTSKQLSCSWGWKDDERSLDPIFKENAAQGQSVFVATGDSGSRTPASTVWPSDDPWITAVGGTDLTTSGPGGPWLSETGWQYSAGMASKNGIPIPKYQQLPGVIGASNGGSLTLRNIPDVALESNTDQWSCFDGHCVGGSGGTSYASPAWAGFLALANQQAASAGAAPIGFLNPALYRIGLSAAYTATFHDVTSGSNGQYTAVPGFDLVTGWGSFIGPNLIDLLARR